METNHDIENKKVIITEDGNDASVEYDVHDGTLDIVHTFVPHPLEGRGIASQLVRTAYDYAREKGLKPTATCTYAKAWLDRHPDYR